MIVVTNLFNGVDYYSLSNRNLLGSIGVEITDNCPTSIVFAKRGLVAFGGGSGVVQVARLFPSEVVQTLEVEGTCFAPGSCINLDHNLQEMSSSRLLYVILRALI